MYRKTELDPLPSGVSTAKEGQVINEIVRLRSAVTCLESNIETLVGMLSCVLKHQIPTPDSNPEKQAKVEELVPLACEIQGIRIEIENLNIITDDTINKMEL